MTRPHTAQHTPTMSSATMSAWGEANRQRQQFVGNLVARYFSWVYGDFSDMRELTARGQPKLGAHGAAEIPTSQPILDVKRKQRTVGFAQ